MLNLLESIGEIWLDQIYWFGGLLVVFTALARFSPAVKAQGILRRGFRIDVLYWFIAPLIYAPIYLVSATVLITLMFDLNGAEMDAFLTQGRAFFHDWPIWLQCLSILLISDVIQYWAHRALHGKRLWRWHAIHHMSEELDWLSQARFHPVDTAIRGVSAGLVTLAIGFAPQAFAYLAVFNVFYSALVHANLDWHFGPLRYVLASPVFHRWHHTSPEVAGNTNFAPTFPFLDLLWGTFHMPKGDNPNRHGFGVSDVISHKSFVAQMTWPFRPR